jgi:transcriptional regulator with XRE-family HTH domain
VKDDSSIGQRIREVRKWRNLSLLVVADSAGITEGQLSKLESGTRSFTNRAVLEAIALALRVSPYEFDKHPWERPENPLLATAHAGVLAIEGALDDYDHLGVDPGGPIRAWPAIASDVARLIELMHVLADYAAQSEMVPTLLAELHAVYVRQPVHRENALLALIATYSSAAWVTKRIGGGRGLPLLAAMAAQRCAEELGQPQWLGYTAWLRGDATGALSRPRQYERAVAAADELRPALDTPDVIQASGMLHLSAALAAAVQGNRDTANTHLAEASALSRRLDGPVGRFASLWFGSANVGIWTTSIAKEFGDEPGAINAIAQTVLIEAIPSSSRRAEFYADWALSLLRDKRSSSEGLTLLLRAEELASQRIHADVLISEAVAAQLRQARSDAGGRDLRGLAYRMGVAPSDARVR